MCKKYTGKKYGLWKVIKDKDDMFLTCKCECGTIRDVRRYDLEKGKSKSCGCILRKKTIERNTTHGLSGTKIYKVYKSIKKRCLNKKDKRYIDYGGRGIKICKEWETDFMNFCNWAIENGYEQKLCIDRIDNDGNYCPENCRWTTYEEQNRNKRNNIMVGNMCLKEWCKKNNFIYSSVYDYVRRHRLNKNNAVLEELEKYKERRNDDKNF